MPSTQILELARKTEELLTPNSLIISLLPALIFLIWNLLLSFCENEYIIFFYC